MRSPHLQGGALLTACAAGQGAIVVVEGEHREDDEWFYSQWFGDLSLRISFFAQDGWEKVVAAVAYLRAELPHRAIFGIVDGDFVDPNRETTREPGLHRIPRYTLENYLLEPEGWFRLAEQLTHGSLPVGWQSSEDVDRRIDDAFGECLSLAAFNRTLFDEHLRFAVDRLDYRGHPDVFAKESPQAVLAAWGAHRGAPRALADVFEEHLVRLRASTRDVWHAEVTGKAVLKVFLRELKLAVKISMKDQQCCALYVLARPQPHTDLKQIIDTVLVEAALPR